MPLSSAHPCAEHGCPALVRGQARCPQHARPQWRGTTTPARVRGRQLQARRRRLFQRQPLCVVCLQQGNETLASIRDHVIPLAEGGRDDETNEQALCQQHSDEKTQREAARGRAR